MTSRSERRRSGVWQTQKPDKVRQSPAQSSQAQRNEQGDAMATEKERRHRWTQDKSRREPSMYDEWLAEGHKHDRMSQQAYEERPSSRRPSMPLRQGSTTASSATIRPVTPETHEAVGMEHRNSRSDLSERTTMNFERVFIPHTTTTIVGGAAARSNDSPSGSSRSRRPARDPDWDRESRMGQASSPPSSRNGSVSITSSFLGGHSSTSSKSNGQWQHGVMSEDEASYRPRTRTLDDRTRREQSPTALVSQSRNRVGSVHTPSSPIYQGGAAYLASVPGSIEALNAPSVSSLGSPVELPSETPGRRSISPISSGTADSITSALPTANARRILHLMKTLNGRMSGNVTFRRGFGNPWSQSYCYIHEESGSLMYESRAAEGAHKTLVSDLRGSKVRSNLDGDVPYLEVSFPHTDDEVHIKMQTQTDFDAWFAALLYWTPRDTYSAAGVDQRPGSEMGSKPPTMSSQRRASMNNPPNSQSRDRASSNMSQKSDRRKSVIATLTKENPVIKIGKMIYWDTNVGYSNSTATAVGQPTSGRPVTNRLQSVGSRRWRRISGQLRENGELKLHSDADNSLISVVQLSQLSRCAIQRLDSSVLDNDWCIAIYPQYTSSYTNTQPGFIRPIFLSLESRVLYEVWFVLLRAFTMPSIYGPRLDEEGEPTGDRDLENMIATSTTYTFRMERSLNVRVVEAKMQPPPANNGDAAFSGGYHRQQVSSATPDKQGYYAEVLLDNETRGKTVAKFEGANPLWGESFEFQDLPPVLNSASVIVKRRPPEHAPLKEGRDHKQIKDAYGGEQQGGFTSLAFDVTCGKVEIQMEELEPEKEVEKWWPVINMHGERVGEILVKIRADEGIILMARDYRELRDLLHRFSNALTLQIAQMIPSELKRLSDSLLNIYQVSGKAGDWIMALVEEEIDGIHKDTPITRLRYSRRAGSNDNHDQLGNGAVNSDRELIVRDMNRNATLEANLLFRGNTLLTKSLDTHMRRVGKEYLEESIAAKIQEIDEKDLDCEVDPNRVQSPQDVDRNWRRLLLFTQEVWKGIIANKARCPIELRIIFRHIRACAEDRYGDFLRSVSYSSVSGFLFLRFFCPAVLNPKLFGLLHDDIKPRARRTFTLIAKSLQTMANMASFGTKEPWMEPMNAFLVQHRESFKTFIDDVCYVPAPLSTATFGPNSPSSPTYPPGVVSAEQHLSYTTPMTIMQRLPPSSREGFPSLPYLIDQARSFADLIHLWLEATSALSNKDEAAALPGKTHSDVIAAIEASEGDLRNFHHLCEELNTRTQDCLNRAERAERPDSPHSFQWEDVINQLQKHRGPDGSGKDPFDVVADKIASDPSILPDDANPAIEATLAQLHEQGDDGDDNPAKTYSRVPSSEPALQWEQPRSATQEWTGRPGSAIGNSVGRNYPQSLGSPGASTSASMSNVSSAVSSDNEPTALPNYDREVRHRERRETARLQIQKQMEAARFKESQKKEKKVNKLVPGLRKKNKLEKESSTKSNETSSGDGNGMI